MITRPNPAGPPVVKVLDFGLARFESESDQGVRLTQLGRIVGTVDYIAPEQAQNARTADIRADVYSLGCSLFYLLTGRPPFGGDDTVERVGGRLLGEAPSVRRDRPEVSAALDGVIAKMMARKPEDRYQTPGEVAEALEPHAGEGTSAPSDVSPSKGRGSGSARTVSDDFGTKGAGPRPRPPKQRDEDETLERSVIRSGGRKKRGTASKLPYLIGGGLLLAALFSVLLVVMLQGKPKDGVLVVEVDQPGAEVYVDGRRHAITRPDGKEPVSIKVQEGSRQLKVVKGGFETFTREVTVKPGGKENVRVRLEPVALARKEAPKADKGQKGEDSYLSDMAEFDVRVAEGRFAKGGGVGLHGRQPAQRTNPCQRQGITQRTLHVSRIERARQGEVQAQQVGQDLPRLGRPERLGRRPRQAPRQRQDPHAARLEGHRRRQGLVGVGADRHRPAGAGLQGGRDRGGRAGTGRGCSSR
jgi:hypothetical protein